MKRWIGSKAWRALRDERLELARARGEGCAFCGEPIDWDLSGRDRWGPTADHVNPRGEGAATLVSLDELQPMHNRCNVARGNQLRHRTRVKGATMIAAGLEHLATPVGELKPLPNNPRRGNVDAVAKSLHRFGQRKPIIARSDGTIIAGNHTWLAAKKLGWDTIAVVTVADDDQEAIAYALADNRTADLGDYDDEVLAALLAPLRDTDIMSATGYTQDDLDKMLSDLTPALPEPGDADMEDMPSLWGVVVEVDDELQQVDLLERLTDEGLRVRALVD